MKADLVSCGARRRGAGWNRAIRSLRVGAENLGSFGERVSCDPRSGRGSGRDLDRLPCARGRSARAARRSARTRAR